MKKILNIALLVSFVAAVSFSTLAISQIDFYNSITFLLISLSLFISSIALKILANNEKFKLIAMLVLLINILGFYALKTPDFLREYKLLIITPLIILIGITISSSIKSNSQGLISKIGTISSLILTGLLATLTVFNITVKWYFTLIFIFLIATTLSFIFSLLKKSNK